MRKSAKLSACLLSVLLLFSAFFTPMIGAAAVPAGTNPVIYFEMPESWGKVTETTHIFAHFWVNGGEEYAAWQTRLEKMQLVEGRTFRFELTHSPYEEDSPYWDMVIFSMYNGPQTYDLTVSQFISGATAYVTGETIENPIDSNKISQIARWKQSNVGGPHLTITSTGKIVGDALLPGETTDDVLKAWTKNYPSLATEDKVAELKKAFEELEINRPALPEYDYIANEADRTATLVSYNGEETDITLPSLIGGYQVTDLADTLFTHSSAEIKRVNIPATIQKVAPRTFLPCGSLTEIAVAENSGYLSSLDGILFDKEQQTLICYPPAKGAASALTPYTYYTVPASVTRIYDGAFYRSSHDNMVVDCGENVTEFGDIFYNYYSYPPQLRYQPPRLLLNGQILIGSNDAAKQAADTYRNMAYAQHDGDYAITQNGILIRYYGNETAVTLPAGVKHIFGSAFFDCPQIESVKIGPYTESIQAEAFSNCPNLKEFGVSLFNQNFSVLDGLLYNVEQNILIACPATKSGLVDLPEVTGLSIDPYAFQNCKNITGFSSSTVTSIGKAAFSGCSGLTSVTLKNGGRIGEYAFADCTALNNISFSGPSLIGSNAFLNCNALTALDLSNAVLEWNALTGCENLKKVWLLKERFTAQDAGYLPAVETVVFKTGTKVIEDHAFNGLSSLRTVAIPPSVISAGFSTFENCPDLTIYGVKGSYAQTYANELGIPFEAVDESYFDSVLFMKKGDIDGDGAVKTNDVILLQKYLSMAAAFTPDQMLAADTNGNGKLEVNDVLTIQKYLAKIIDEI